jgi:hypothetical protein
MVVVLIVASEREEDDHDPCRTTNVFYAAS